MKIELNVSDEALVDVLDGAGSRYWCHSLDIATADIFVGSCWAALLAGKLDHIIVYEDRSEEGDETKAHRVTRASIARGLQLMLEANHEQLGNVLHGYESRYTDQWTGDSLLQFAVFGEQKYN